MSKIKNMSESIWGEIKTNHPIYTSWLISSFVLCRFKNTNSPIIKSQERVTELVFSHLNEKYNMKYSDANPYKTIQINPKNVTYYTAPSIEVDQDRSKRDLEIGVFTPHHSLGKVVGGEWDKPVNKFSDTLIYKSFINHFRNETAWENTEWFNHYADKIAEGISIKNCSTISQFEKRCSHIDKLYKDIEQNGYRSQKEIKDGTLFGEVVVNIGRDGKLLFNDGRHRLTIAKILELPEIPVQVLVRHPDWQSVRNKINSSNEVENMCLSTSVDLSHPDLTDIL